MELAEKRYAQWLAFKYLINECYSRDMSMKTRSAKYAKMRRGEYQSVICPYGYQKSADGRMEPDKETAAVVKQIFTWAAAGNAAAEIVRKLYGRSIPRERPKASTEGKALSAKLGTGASGFPACTYFPA